MARKWLEGAAKLRQETVTKPFTKTPGKRADELIRGSLSFYLPCFFFSSCILRIMGLIPPFCRIPIM